MNLFQRGMLASTGVVFLIMGGWFFLEKNAYHSTGNADENIRFVVLKGAKSTVIAEELERARLIDSAVAFLYYVWKEDARGRIQAGEYSLSGGMTIPEIVEKFVSGDTIPLGIKITFPEGWTAKEMAVRLEENGFSAEKFLELVRNPKPEWRSEFSFLATLPSGNSLEGFLFPDTYYFDGKLGEESVIEKMLENFELKALPAFDGTSSDKPMFYARLILASIVEMEVRTDSDRKMVSDIFLRRIATGMPLQSDATVRYALGVTKIQHSAEDLAIDSPYNSYKYPGLPPGPISNPGLESIGAVLHPTSNQYWYFLNNPKTGETVFSTTFDEHVANKGKHGL